MGTGAITGYIDVAQVSLYVFWLFFAGLIIYLRKEDKREGYPLVTDQPGELLQGWPLLPSPKTFLLPNGTTVTVPGRDQPEPPYTAVPSEGFVGAPLLPIGNAMLAGAGPAAFTMRDDTPDRLNENGECRILPLRLLPGYYVAEEGPDPIGMDVIGADGVIGGSVVDLWLDRAEDLVRYLEVNLADGGNILVPMPLAKVGGGVVNVVSILGTQFAAAPKRVNPDEVTKREEDRTAAYFGGGHMYATPSRMEPLL
jgi:photosynthetic reaction center H subunit